MADIATDYFAQLFQSSEYHIDEELFNNIPSPITSDLNDSFCALPSDEEIWKSRCRAVFDEEKMNSTGILRVIQHNVQLMSRIHNPKRRATLWENTILDRLLIPLKNPQLRRGTWVAWHRPAKDYLKLNVDGSLRNNTSTGGGVLRDHKGEF